METTVSKPIGFDFSIEVLSVTDEVILLGINAKDQNGEVIATSLAFDQKRDPHDVYYVERCEERALQKLIKYMRG
jgi:hypothetical protein